MPSIDVLIAFFAAAAVFAYLPGPSLLYTAARTLAGGRRAGWLATIGIHMGGYVHVLAAAFGLAVIFSATPYLYLALKFIGAAYLIWLGIGMIRTQSTLDISPIKLSQKSTNRAFWDSATVEILNPKTAIFYIAFLPQFTDASAQFPLWLQFLILGTIVNFMFTSADALCVVLSSKILELFKGSGSLNRWLHRISGTLLIGLGVRLATSNE